MEICQDLLGQIKRDPDFLNNVMSPVDESRVFEYDPEKTAEQRVAHPKLTLSRENKNEQIQNRIRTA